MRLRSFLVCLALVAGCGTSSTATPTDVLVGATCDRLLHCDSGNDAYFREFVGTTSDCEQIVESALLSALDFQAYVDAGQARLDRDRLASCKAAIADDPCVPFDELWQCDGVYVGTVPGGSGCSSDFQCESGACTAVAGQCGTCLAPAALGASCDPLQQNCARDPSGPVECRPNPTTGGTCVLETSSYLSVGLGQDCSSSGGVERFCVAPLHCDAADVCAERAAIGAACDPDVDSCAIGSLCVEGPSSASCVATVVVTQANQPCGLLSTGAFGRCDAGAGLYCGEGTAGTVCLELAGSGAENSECLVDGDCDPGLLCVVDFESLPGSCERRNKPDGAACEVPGECASGVCQFSPAALARVCTAITSCP